ncbi:hypothetical protein EVAR_30446_1 [Eumeta japonica]|uniref:Uncharacterized protein n=1 Tax=Eumeta variegata TaxID=151549 RepID=A0A4C1VZ14_EUMVA|nr:hypothetical protein EVAR_30446_1 [Eumeta japonica]
MTELLVEAEKQKITKALVQKSHVEKTSELRWYPGCGVVQRMTKRMGHVKAAIIFLDKDVDVGEDHTLNDENVTAAVIKDRNCKIGVALYICKFEKSVMALCPENISFGSSATTIPHDDSDCADTIKSLVKDLLKSKIFLGRYVERRLVDNHLLYRDIVLVSAAEVELNRDLLEARRYLKAFYPTSHWIGITGTELLEFATSGTCIWTEIENEPFGPFWFQIKTVLFKKDEVMLKLKCIRHISESFLELEPLLIGAGRLLKVLKAKKQKTLGNISDVKNTEGINFQDAFKKSIKEEFLSDEIKHIDIKYSDKFIVCKEKNYENVNFDEILAAHAVTLPMEVKIQIEDAITELEAADYQEWGYEAAVAALGADDVGDRRRPRA